MSNYSIRPKDYAVFMLSTLLMLFGSPAVSKSMEPPFAQTIGTLFISPGSENERKEMRRVVFNHDAHTRAMKAAGKDCNVCHDPFDDKASAPERRFKGTAGKKREDLKTVYHSACISCHAEWDKGSSGPLLAQCRSCHKDGQIPERLFLPKFSKALHYIHMGSKDLLDSAQADARPYLAPGALLNLESQTNCTVCHHAIPGASPALEKPEAKNPDTCRACHQSGPGTGLSEVAKRLSPPNLHLVSHKRCIGCHLKKTAEGKKGGPHECAGCHDAEVWFEYEKRSPKARLDAGQPVAILMQPVARPAVDGSQPEEAAWKSSMPLVGFNHERHQKSQPSCQSCHHGTVRQSCTSCHTPYGSAKGNNIPLSRVMHTTTGAHASCVSCHNLLKYTQSACIGCHLSGPATRNAEDCYSCHKPLDQLSDENKKRFLSSANTPQPLMPATPTMNPATPGLAENALPESPPYASLPMPEDTTAHFDLQKDVPEIVTIDILTNEYEKVDFKHREHIRQLMNAIEKNAPSFLPAHTKGYALCLACHHNSPAIATPPKCVACHTHTGAIKGQPLTKDERPQLKSAYHLQCMNCHDRMEQEKSPRSTDCEKCHAIKPKNP